MTLPYATSTIGSLFGSSNYTGFIDISQGGYAYKIPSSLESIRIRRGAICDYAFQNCKNITSVKLDDDVESIGNYAFSACTNLKLLNIPAKVNTIGNNAFDGVNYVSELTLPASCTSIGTNAFYNMNGLQTINVLGDIAPNLADVNSLNNHCIVYLTADAKSECLKDANWFAHKYQLIAVSDKTEYEADVTALADKSALHMAIGENNLQKVITLKVSGTINSFDLMLMRNKMVNLKYLDLSEASIVDNSYEYFNNNGDGYHSVANTLTRYALQPNLFSVKLPATLTAINDYSLQELMHVNEIVVPANVKTIGKSAAEGLKYLKSLKFEEGSQLETINSNAFYNCSDITELSIPGSVKSMAGNAIYGCNSLNKFTLEDGEENLALTAYSNSCPLTEVYLGRNISANYPNSPLGGKSLDKITIGNGVIALPKSIFYNSKCSSIIVPPSLSVIGADAFWSNKTTDIYIEDINAWSNISGLSTLMSTTTAKNIYLNGEKIETLDLTGVETMQNYAFEHTTITGVNIPKNSTLAEIPDYAFAYTNIDKLQMPISITTLGAYAFNSCPNLKEVKLPSSIHSIGNHAFDECPNLYDVYTYTIEPQDIDQFTFSTYKTATLHCPKVSYYNYYYNTQWSQFLKLVDFDEPYDYIFIDKDVTINDQTGDIDGTPDADINAGGGLIVDGIDQNLDEVHIKYDGTANVGASLIGRAHANKIYLDIDVKADYWYYFSFPFNVDLVTIQKSGGYVFRYYDSESRANGKTGNWKDVAAGTTHLNAGTGYIFRTNTAGILTICIDKGTVEKNDLTVNKVTAVNSYTATTGTTADDNKSWNFIGNPYLCYYSIDDLDYGAPIIIWNGTDYEAVRPGDDDVTLYPFQAFFIQKPENVDGVGFSKDAQMTYIQSQDETVKSAKHRARAARMNIDRKLINLTLSDGENTDKTRVVFNDKQSLGFEAECDASKFAVSSSIPQMFSIGNDNIKYSINERPVSDGKVKLGYAVPAKGKYTIGTTRMDAHVFIEDAATGTLHDLEDGDYTFESEAGTNTMRFTLILADDEATAIEILNHNNVDESEGNVYDMNGRRVKNAKGIVIKNGKKVMVK